MSNITTSNDVKKLAKTIEVLAKDVQAKLDSGGDFLGSANELVRNNMTFVFTLGEFYALQKSPMTSSSGVKKTVKAKVVSKATNPSNWHNVRDSRGRFARKI